MEESDSGLTTTKHFISQADHLCFSALVYMRECVFTGGCAYVCTNVCMIMYVCLHVHINLCLVCT